MVWDWWCVAFRALYKAKSCEADNWSHSPWCGTGGVLHSELCIKQKAVKQIIVPTAHGVGLVLLIICTLTKMFHHWDHLWNNSLDLSFRVWATVWMHTSQLQAFIIVKLVTHKHTCTYTHLHAECMYACIHTCMCCTSYTIFSFVPGGCLPSNPAV